MITAEQMKEMELRTPKYEFVEPDAEAPKVSPIKQPIAKIQETAQTFTLYDVYRTIGQLDKRITDKQAEIEADEKLKKLFEAEIELIEKALGVSDLERQYHVEVAVEHALLTPKPNEEDSAGN